MSEPSEPPCPENPQRSTQFKPGQSGNPRGRPKRNIDISLALNNALNDKIRVSSLGKTRTGMEAMVQAIVDRVLQGDSKGIPALMTLLNKTKLIKAVPDPTRLTGVVVAPLDYVRDKELSIQQGSYLFKGIRLWVNPITKELGYDRPADYDENA
jgi:hypothetical protein